MCSFNKETDGETYGTPYDFSSIMHNPSTYQSKDGVLPTIIALDPLEMPYLGNAVMPSFYDLKELNLAYYCPNSAADVGCDLVCVNDGYLFSPYDNNGGSNCSCGCKPQYTGTYCELANPDFVPRCIQRFTIDDGLTGTISSPNYPFNYDPDMICQYIITGPAESNISLQFTDFILQPGNQTCTNDYLDIFLADTALADTTICGSVAPSAFDSNSNEIRIVFKSDSTIQDKGFSLMYTIHIEPSCNVSFNSSVGGIPNYVSESLVNTHCTYEINVPEGQRVALTLQSFDVQNGYCSVSSIEVYLGDGTSTPIQFCDQCVPKEEIISATNMMKIIFAVQGSEDKTSFYATYRAVEKIAINSSNPDVEGSTCSHCQSTTDQDKGYIQSPRYPQAYRRRMCCQYEITAPPGLHVELNFARIFQIEEEDTISIDIGGSQPIRLILTGHNAPIGSYVSHAEKMSIRFESNESWFAGRGFRAFFRSVSLSIPKPMCFVIVTYHNEAN
ncbi:protein SpAN-like isoform X1 [Strongylocentrotus purpuratus]|uniref:Metalloendopeptidase n=2 Tax=Strongylocentrotus purpuratus TaxID=7668 RepID=A0A7M7NYR9_STRPU|nr:protein SpAN-like isoform X1 [Strongylocentrotus purpuratus]